MSNKKNLIILYEAFNDFKSTFNSLKSPKQIEWLYWDIPHYFLDGFYVSYNLFKIQFNYIILHAFYFAINYQRMSYNVV